MDGQDEFAPDPSCFFVASGVYVRIEHNLDEAFPVSKVDEDHTPVVPAPVGPAHQHHLLPNMGGVDIPAIMGSFP